MNIDIARGISLVLNSKRRLSPQHTNRASSLDDPCERRLYYRRVNWDKAAPTPESLLGVFETGTILEPIIERIISEVGVLSDPPFRIVGSQTPTNDKFMRQYEISGHIDGFLQILSNGQWVTVGVVDIKTCSANIYPRINSYDDLAKYSWTKAYRGQLQTYALAHELENCFILFVNKHDLYQMKFVHFPLDMEYMERIIQKAERINLAVACAEPPQGINDGDKCPDCPFFSWCAPDFTTGGNLRIIDDAELEAVMDRMGELSESAGEYEDLKKQRDDMLVKGRDVCVG
ncbi:MAG: PD-(D/E)XK nuclease family protein, partial [Candidatus Omnitrophota bacterium]